MLLFLTKPIHIPSSLQPFGPKKFNRASLYWRFPSEISLALLFMQSQYGEVSPVMSNKISISRTVLYSIKMGAIVSLEDQRIVGTGVAEMRKQAS
jgi:hypothetical protein